MNLWVFGDRYGIPYLQNAAIDAIINRQSRTELTPAGFIAFVYANTPEKCPLRMLLVDMCGNLGYCFWFAEHEGTYHGKFLLDLAKAQCGLMRKEKKAVVDFEAHCKDYHVPTTWALVLRASVYGRQDTASSKE